MLRGYIEASYICMHVSKHLASESFITTRFDHHLQAMYVYTLGLSDYRDSIHYPDSLRLFMNKIVDCLTIE